MKSILRLGLSIALASMVIGCATKPPGKDYSIFYDLAPRSILIVPVINHTAEVEAADLFLTTLAVPLAERGYYVFPTNLTKKVIETEGLSDPQLVHSAPTEKLAHLFNADSVLYVEILEWKSNYSVISSSIGVKFLYTLKSGKSGGLIWQDEREFIYSSSSSSGNIIADVIANAIVSAVNNQRADYTPVAMQANSLALLTEGQGIPYGPYSPIQESNLKSFQRLGTGKVSNATVAAVAYPVASDAGRDKK